MQMGSPLDRSRWDEFDERDLTHVIARPARHFLFAAIWFLATSGVPLKRAERVPWPNDNRQNRASKFEMFQGKSRPSRASVARPDPAYRQQ